MNKVQVGAAPSPNLKSVRSKIGSLDNTTHRPGGGNIKIENKKLDFSNAQSRITAKNETYQPTGGDKKVIIKLGYFYFYFWQVFQNLHPVFRFLSRNFSGAQNRR